MSVESYVRFRKLKTESFSNQWETMWRSTCIESGRTRSTTAILTDPSTVLLPFSPRWGQRPFSSCSVLFLSTKRWRTEQKKTKILLQPGPGRNSNKVPASANRIVHVITVLTHAISEWPSCSPLSGSEHRTSRSLMYQVPFWTNYLGSHFYTVRCCETTRAWNDKNNI
jgi:hypothetical protein